MKVVILCGGVGSRIDVETRLITKPMVKIGNKPILEHIMGIYEHYGCNEFILALGYKSEYIKKFYKNKNKKNINLVYTGKDTKTGGRLLRLKNYLKNEKTFMLTYGDGVSNINIKKAIQFHNNHGKIATITAVRPPVRFGELKINRNKVKSFKEKPQVGQGWVNGGFFIFNNEVLNFIKDDQTMLEREPLEKLTRAGQLMAFEHKGFWKCMDTMRDKILLNKLWNKGNALWKK